MQGRHLQTHHFDPCGHLLAFTVIVVAALCIAGDTWATFEDGVKAYRSGDYERARYEWLPVAAENDERALFNLGQMYRLGKGVDVNMYVAEQYYRRAAAQGHVQAMGSLGSVHFSKKPPMVEEAFYYWRQAAAAGDPRSRLNLGVEYFNGDHLERNNALAYAWITLAAEAGLAEADDALKVLGEYLSAEDIEQGKLLAATLTQEPVRLVADAKRSPRPAPKPAKPSRSSNPFAGMDTKKSEPEGKPEPQPVEPEIPDIVVAAVDPPVKAPERLSAPEQEAVSKPAAPSPVVEAEQIRVTVVQSSRVWPATGQDLAGTQDRTDEIFRIQLASMQSLEAAERQKTRLKHMHDGILGDMVLTVDEMNLGPKRGRYFRVISEPLESADAGAALCAKLRPLGVSCTQLRTILIVSIVGDDVMDLRPILPKRDGESDQESNEEPGAVKDADSAVISIPVPRNKPKTPGQAGQSSPRRVLKSPPLHVTSSHHDTSVPDNYRVQVASLRSDQEAREKWRSINARHAASLTGMKVYFHRAVVNGRGIYHRVQLGHFATRNSANELCARLKQSGSDCFVVASP